PASVGKLEAIDPDGVIVKVEVPGFPTTVITPVPRTFIFPAVGKTAPPELPVKLFTTPVPTVDTVRVLVPGLPTILIVTASPITLMLRAPSAKTGPPVLPVKDNKDAPAPTNIHVATPPANEAK